jgi:hypothetical protein
MTGGAPPRNPSTETLWGPLGREIGDHAAVSTESRSSALPLPDMRNSGGDSPQASLTGGGGSGGVASPDGSGRRLVAGERPEKGRAGGGGGGDIKMHSVSVCHGH